MHKKRQCTVSHTVFLMFKMILPDQKKQRSPSPREEKESAIKSFNISILAGVFAHLFSQLQMLLVSVILVIILRRLPTAAFLTGASRGNAQLGNNNFYD